MSDHIVSLLQLGQFSCGTRPSKMNEKLQRMNSTWDEQRLGLTMLWATFSVKNRWKCDQHLNVIIIKGEWSSVKKMVIHRIYTETPNMRVIVSVPWHCQNVDPSTCQCAKSYIVDCEGVFGTEEHPYPPSPTLQSWLSTIWLFGCSWKWKLIWKNTISVLLKRSSQLWWGLWTAEIIAISTRELFFKAIQSSTAVDNGCHNKHF